MGGDQLREIAAHLSSLYQRGEPSVVHAKHELVERLRDIPFLNSLDALLAEWPSVVRAQLPDLRDEVSSLDLKASEARKYFDQGMCLLFDDIDKISPELTESLAAVKRALKLSALTYGRCLVYATPHGKGTAPHFDQNINFVIQLSGTKKWILAKNENVENPLTRHTMGLPADPELSTYLDSPLATQMPKKSVSFELKPGSILYVPRGWWHETEAEGDALALNFTFTAPAWMDLFLAALRSRLALSPEWRATALMSHDERAQLDELLVELVGDLPNWKASDILKVTEG